jgi:hypothetical protein
VARRAPSGAVTSGAFTGAPAARTAADAPSARTSACGAHSEVAVRPEGKGGYQVIRGNPAFGVPQASARAIARLAYHQTPKPVAYAALGPADRRALNDELGSTVCAERSLQTIGHAQSRPAFGASRRDEPGFGHIASSELGPRTVRAALVLSQGVPGPALIEALGREVSGPPGPRMQWRSARQPRAARRER